MDNTILHILASTRSSTSVWSNYLKQCLPWYNLYKIEKDFWLTHILHWCAKNTPDLIFKWGTCLNKCYFGYYRLSEDLDFSLISSSSRKERSKLSEATFDKLGTYLTSSWMTLLEQRKRDESRFGGMRRSYASDIDRKVQTIQFDFKIIGWYQLPIQEQRIQDVFTHPLTWEKLFAKQTIQCISLDEAMAEKVRASLTRKTPAIRDLYDIRYAKKQWFVFENIKDLIAHKVDEVWWEIILFDAYDELKKQIETDLVPVIHDADTFEFDATFEFVYKLASR